MRGAAARTLAAVAMLAVAASLPAEEQEAGPSVEVREVSVRKNRPDEVFHNAGTAVTFWVRDEAGEFTRILANGTEFGEFADSAGTDLIAGHREQIRAWEEKVDRLREEGRWVSMGRNRELYRADRLDWDEGVAGFYLVVESWDVPAPEADSLTVAGEISYIVSTGERFREVFEEIDLHETKIIPVGDYAVRPSDFNPTDGVLRFALYADIDVTRFDVRNADGEVVGEINHHLNDRPVVRMPEELFEEPVHLTIEYREPIERRVEVDRVIKVGL